jgi:hypothetical protein
VSDDDDDDNDNDNVCDDDNDVAGSGHGLNLRYYHGIYPEGLRKTRKTSVSISCYGPSFETGTSRIRSRILTTQPRRFVTRKILNRA